MPSFTVTSGDELTKGILASRYIEQRKRAAARQLTDRYFIFTMLLLEERGRQLGVRQLVIWSNQLRTFPWLAHFPAPTWKQSLVDCASPKIIGIRAPTIIKPPFRYGLSPSTSTTTCEPSGDCLCNISHYSCTRAYVNWVLVG